jgi:hypothetical protein
VVLQQVPSNAAASTSSMHCSAAYTSTSTIMTSLTCTDCTSEAGDDHPSRLRFLELLSVVPLLLALLVVSVLTTGCCRIVTVDTQEV